MKPFNLKKALEGAPVITRGGDPVVNIAFFNGMQNRPVVAYIDDEDSLHRFYKDGTYDDEGHPTEYDLFMGPILKKIYINIYKDSHDCDAYRLQLCDSLLDAKRWSSEDPRFLKTIDTEVIV